MSGQLCILSCLHVHTHARSACDTLVLVAAADCRAAVFEKRTKYGVCVSCSRHPELNAYVRAVLQNCRPLLQRGLVERLLVCVCDARGMPSEYTSVEVEVRAPALRESAPCPCCAH